VEPNQLTMQMIACATNVKLSALHVSNLSSCQLNFDVLLTVHLSIILVINQLNAQILVL